MDRIKEKEMYLEMLQDLVKQRRVLSEEILLVRNHLSELEKDIERHEEYMSATEYINIRNSIRRELEAEMRVQVKEEIIEENTEEEVESSSVIDLEIIKEAKFNENQKAIKKDISPEAIAEVVKNFLKDLGRPASVDEIYEHVQENRNHSWQRKTFNTMLWKVKQIEPRVDNVSRGYYQYNWSDSNL